MRRSSGAWWPTRGSEDVGALPRDRPGRVGTMRPVPSPFGPISLIVNPHAGRGRVGEHLAEVERNLRARDLDYEVHPTSGPGDATRLAAEALDRGRRYVVAVGGDGTVNEVINGMMRDGKARADDAVLGVVGAGSGCDLVRTFGLPGDASRACTHLEGDNVYPFDVGRVRFRAGGDVEAERYFGNVAEVGLGGAVARRADRLPRWVGAARYFVGFWLTLPGAPLAHVRVRAGRQVYEGPGYAIVIGNAQFYGGGMRISPRSYPGDGAMDVLVFMGPKTDAFTMIPRIYRGEHVPHPHVHEMRTRDEIEVDADRPLDVEVDGEWIGRTPMTIEVIPRPLSIKI